MNIRKSYFRILLKATLPRTHNSEVVNKLLIPTLLVSCTERIDSDLQLELSTIYSLGEDVN